MLLALKELHGHSVGVPESKARDVMQELVAAIPAPIAHDDPPEEPLFHYTDAFGLEGILKSKALRATQFQQLNDSREFVEGDELVRAVAEELAAAEGLSAGQKSIRTEFCALRDEMAFARILPDTFVASFTEDGDELSQWRGYGAGGAGFSIGVRLRKGEQAPGAIVTHLGAVFVKVKYDSESYRKRIADQLTDAFETIEKTVLSVSPATEEARMPVYHKGMALAHHRAGALVLPIKHKAFAAEREWRIIAMPNGDAPSGVVKVRPTANGFVRYVDFPLVARAADAIELAAVYVGPKQDRAIGVAATRALLESFGYDPALVKLSAIPFR